MITLRCDAHAYTHSSEPLRLDLGTEAYGAIAPEHKAGWRLYHYISGGGMRTFGRTLEQDARSRRQTRFLVFFAAALAVWLLLIFV